MNHSNYIKITISLVFALFLGISSLKAQTSPKGNYNFYEFNKKPFYFGLTLGGHSSGYLTSNSRNLIQHDSIQVIQGKDIPGLHVNIITNLKIGQYFDFRFIPGFSFTERKIRFIDSEISEIEIQEERIESVFLEIPMLLRFKSAPYRDKRLFVVAGLKYTYDVASNSKARQDQTINLLKIAPHDFQFEIGAGIQFFFPFFIFSPEIKYSQSIGNIHVFNSSKPESSVIDKILSRTLSISFHFEG